MIEQNQDDINKIKEEEILKEYYLSELSSILNKIHGIDLSPRFWRIVADTYIYELVRTNGFTDFAGTRFEVMEAMSIRDKLTKKIVSLVKEVKSWANLDEYGKVQTNSHVFFNWPAEPGQEGSVKLHTVLKGFLKTRKTTKRKVVREIVEQETRNDIQTMLKHLPEDLVEDFSFYFKQAKKHQKHPASIHYYRVYSLFNKFLIAFWVNKGSCLNIYQHGSGYGEFYKMHINETNVSDNFFTWGWSIDEKHKPGPAYPLEKFKKLYIDAEIKFEDKKDILVCPPAIVSHFRAHVMNSIDALRSDLSKEKYKSILIRPRPKGSGLSYRDEFLSFQDEHIEIDSGMGRNRIAELVKNARLVIHLQSPSTTLLECIYINNPVMSIIKPSRFIPTKIAVEAYNGLIKVGVLHETAESLVKKLNSISSIEEWWSKTLKTPEYMHFKNKFCKNFDNNKLI
jgi:putative transferase (TIGR04331 family)